MPDDSLPAAFVGAVRAAGAGGGLGIAHQDPLPRAERRVGGQVVPATEIVGGHAELQGDRGERVTLLHLVLQPAAAHRDRGVDRLVVLARPAALLTVVGDQPPSRVHP